MIDGIAADEIGRQRAQGQGGEQGVETQRQRPTQQGAQRGAGGGVHAQQAPAPATSTRRPARSSRVTAAWPGPVAKCSVKESAQTTTSGRLRTHSFRPNGNARPTQKMSGVAGAQNHHGGTWDAKLFQSLVGLENLLVCGIDAATVSLNVPSL